jgi:DNA polymerase-1
MDKNRLLDIFSKIDKEESKPNFHLNSRILLVDGINTFLRGFAAVTRSNLMGHDVGGIIGFLKSVGHAIKILNPTRVIIVFDGESGSVNRKYLYPPYKANRNRPRILNRRSFDNKEDEDESKYEQVVRLMDYLSYLPLISISIDRLEADDVIGYITEHVQREYDDANVYIMSTDTDYLQLINNRVKVYSPIKKKIYEIGNVLEEYQVHPINFLLYKILIGDDSDNIPGVSGLGEKNTPKLFQLLSESEAKSIENLYDLCEHPPKKSVLYERVLNVKNDLDIFYRLMDLKEINITEDDENKIQSIYHSPIPIFRKYDFIKLYNHDKMADNIPNLEVWLNLFSVLNSYK